MEPANYLIDAYLIKTKLTWVANKKTENLNNYGKRVSEMLKEYNTLAHLAQLETEHILGTTETREYLAIYSYIKGLKHEIKK